MSDETLNFRNLKSVGQLLERLPNGSSSVELYKRLGLWTTRAHEVTIERIPFPNNLADLDERGLTRLYGSWTAEYGRIVELCGVLTGQDQVLKIRIKSATAKAKVRIRNEREAEEGLKPLSASDLKDAAEEDTHVLELNETACLLVMAQASANAAKHATEQYLSTISREISFRDGQMKARIYGG